CANANLAGIVRPAIIATQARIRADCMTMLLWVHGFAWRPRTRLLFPGFLGRRWSCSECSDLHRQSASSDWFPDAAGWFREQEDFCSGFRPARPRQDPLLSRVRHRSGSAARDSPRPGIRYATSGAGTNQHFLGEWFAQAVRKATTIPPPGAFVELMLLPGHS